MIIKIINLKLELSIDNFYQHVIRNLKLLCYLVGKIVIRNKKFVRKP